ncbi:UNVERIFIED_ORG: hypothetical protein GGI57_004965 [Rhizobium aethiopicum]
MRKPLTRFGIMLWPHPTFHCISGRRSARENKLTAQC